MEYRIGMIVKGKVTGIQPYGVFVALDEETQGLIHISECHAGFVADIHRILSVGQKVNVMIVDIDEYTSKISLSLRYIENPPQRATKIKVRCNHKHYWTSRKVKTGFSPIQSHLDQWVKEALKGI
ncbi:CvfD/Ygs/GSP13 family RNA-binding post-transcriptional regulator [Liquorilactobacillus vini]|uniref:CvfD/Ygs/GSP13 family RNA-binding post-transcriptional regulator n=1 Tax=Liquorilactobacillus vini TaxID=238015 RepID=UPI0003108076|nr:CvfD/Ygs/GSP13 family RNA-binding post-transcriptional regulator [Liquorilactobacillus vini]